MAIGSNPVKCKNKFMTVFTLQILMCFILILPVVGILSLLITSRTNVLLLKQLSLFNSGLTFLFSLLLWLFFNKSVGSFQFYVPLIWLPFININLNLFNKK